METHSVRSHNVVCVAGDIGKFVKNRNHRSPGSQFGGPEPVVDRKIGAGYFGVRSALREARNVELRRRRLNRARGLRSKGLIGGFGNGCSAPKDYTTKHVPAWCLSVLRHCVAP